VVPVLTLTVLPGMFKYEFGPNSSILALLSERIWEIKKEISDENTFFSGDRTLLKIFFPEKSVISFIELTSRLIPPVAKTE